MQDFGAKIMVIIIIILYYGQRLTCLFLIVRPTDIWISGNPLWPRFILSVHYNELLHIKFCKSFSHDITAAI